MPRETYHLLKDVVVHKGHHLRLHLGSDEGVQGGIFFIKSSGLEEQLRAGEQFYRLYFRRTGEQEILPEWVFPPEDAPPHSTRALFPGLAVAEKIRRSIIEGPLDSPPEPANCDDGITFSETIERFFPVDEVPDPFAPSAYAKVEFLEYGLREYAVDQLSEHLDCRRARDIVKRAIGLLQHHGEDVHESRLDERENPTCYGKLKDCAVQLKYDGIKCLENSHYSDYPPVLHFYALGPEGKTETLLELLKLNEIPRIFSDDRARQLTLRDCRRQGILYSPEELHDLNPEIVAGDAYPELIL